MNPKFFAKKCVLNWDAYLNGCVLKRETTVFEQKMAELSDDFESVLKTSPTAHVLTFAESKRSKNMVSIPIYIITFAKKCRTLHGMVAISPFMLNLYLWNYVLMKLTFEIDFKVNK